jgi:hypothetical protein
LVVYVNIKIPSAGIDDEKSYRVGEKKIKVQVNPIHSVTEFGKIYWKDATAFIFGSGSLLGFIKWIIERQKKLKNSNIKLGSNQESPEKVSNK